MKDFIRRIIGSTGYEIRNRNARKKHIGTQFRPVGNVEYILKDLKKRGLVCKTIIDVGANKTKWSTLTKTIFPDAHFCLIEPQIEMKPYLEKFCNSSNNSVYYLAGAGSKENESTITIWDDLQGSSFLPARNEALLKTGKQREVNLITLDQLINSGKIDLPELIKLDIQGYELEALKGAEKTFGHTEVYIIEVSLFAWSDIHESAPIFSDVVNFMLERNYVVYDFAGFLRRPLDGALGQCDICFVKKDGFLRATNNWE